MNISGCEAKTVEGMALLTNEMCSILSGRWIRNRNSSVVDLQSLTISSMGPIS